MKNHKLLLIGFLSLSMFSLFSCKVGLEELIRSADKSRPPNTAEMTTAIRQALSQGVENAINILGQSDGFNSNELIRIALPEELKKADKLLRRIGQGKYADEFVLTMNRAAERAVPEAASIFSDAVQQLSIKDALDIIQGDDDAATQYFRRTSSKKLVNSFKPIVKQATSNAGVTNQYKKLIGKVGVLGQYFSEDAQDIDAYITNRAIDALFLYIAKEEKKIRDNPIERTTEILARVFDFYSEK